MIARLYNTVMNSERNPLKDLPKAVCFQLMVILAWMWSLIFALWIGSVVAFGISTAAIFLFLAGIFVTAEAFRDAQRRSRGYDDLSNDPKDGHSMHGDFSGDERPSLWPVPQKPSFRNLRNDVHEH